MPLLSVILPVYNAESYIQDAVSSILHQTLHDFELIILDDASKDASVQVIQQFSDPRIRLYVNEQNIGLSSTLNRGLEYASGKFIARMDHDDIALPNRFMEQVRFLSDNPEVGICGSWVQTFGASNRVIKYPARHEMIEASFLFGNVICHPTVMFRSSITKDYGFRYSPDYEYAEDYHFWTQMFGRVRYANIAKPLLRYRLHQEQMTSKSMGKHEIAASKVLCNMLEKLSIHPTQEDILLHQAICLHNSSTIIEHIDKIEHWLIKLGEANQRSQIFDEQAINMVLVRKWLECCATLRRSGRPVLMRFIDSSLSSLSGSVRKILYIIDLFGRKQQKR